MQMVSQIHTGCMVGDDHEHIHKYTSLNKISFTVAKTMFSIAKIQIIISIAKARDYICMYADNGGRGQIVIMSEI